MTATVRTSHDNTTGTIVIDGVYQALQVYSNSAIQANTARFDSLQNLGGGLHTRILQCVPVYVNTIGAYTAPVSADTIVTPTQCNYHSQISNIKDSSPVDDRL